MVEGQLETSDPRGSSRTSHCPNRWQSCRFRTVTDGIKPKSPANCAQVFCTGAGVFAGFVPSFWSVLHSVLQPALT